MTTLTSKFHETTKRLQNLTVWRPSDRDPFLELDRWRTNAHTTIEQIYIKRKQQIEQIIEKHEREFIRQLTRQRSLLNSIRKRLSQQKDMPTELRQQNEPSIFTDLQKVENDIDTRLGRADVIIEIKPFDLEDSVHVGLKTYISETSSMYFKEMLPNQSSHKPPRRSANEVSQAYDKWFNVKKTEQEDNSRKQFQNSKQTRERTQEKRMIKQKASKEAFDTWLNQKKSEGAVTKKKKSTNDNDTVQETNGT